MNEANLGLPLCAGGRAGEIAAGVIFLLWPNAVRSNALIPPGGGRSRLTPEQALAVQQASRQALAAVGMSADELETREYVALLPGALHAETAEMAQKALEVYLAHAPDKRLLTRWSAWLSAQKAKRAARGVQAAPLPAPAAKVTVPAGKKNKPAPPLAKKAKLPGVPDVAANDADLGEGELERMRRV